MANGIAFVPQARSRFCQLSVQGQLTPPPIMVFAPDSLGHGDWPEPFTTIEHCLPRLRVHIRLGNLQVVNTILCVTECGCKWRGLPNRFGSWHPTYTRMNRRTKAGVLDRMFEEFRCAQVLRIKLEAVSLNSIVTHQTGVARVTFDGRIAPVTT